MIVCVPGEPTEVSSSDTMTGKPRQVPPFMFSSGKSLLPSVLTIIDSCSACVADMISTMSDGSRLFVANSASAVARSARNFAAVVPVGAVATMPLVMDAGLRFAVPALAGFTKS